MVFSTRRKRNDLNSHLLLCPCDPEVVCNFEKNDSKEFARKRVLKSVRAIISPVLLELLHTLEDRSDQRETDSSPHLPCFCTPTLCFDSEQLTFNFDKPY